MDGSSQKITKIEVIKKGKKIFGSNEKLNKWLNSEVFAMDCKPITLWDTNEGRIKIYEQLLKLEQRLSPS